MLTGLGFMIDAVTEVLWYVAHTRPRCEKKLVQYCRREAIDATLPCVKSKKRYGRKVVEFHKPLFPGYVFFRSTPENSQRVLHSDYTANVLTVFDQGEFGQQLDNILQAIDSACPVLGAIGLDAGREVRILDGPLEGMSGRVIELSNPATVILRLDFLGQGAAVVVDTDSLEIIE